jgi:hypothetical protein
MPADAQLILPAQLFEMWAKRLNRTAQALAENPKRITKQSAQDDRAKKMGRK